MENVSSAHQHLRDVGQGHNLYYWKTNYRIQMNRLPTLLAVAALLATVAGHQHLACVGAPDFQHYFSPSPQSCSKYVLCVRGEAHIDECQDGLHFDVGQQGCASPEFVDCTRCGPYGFVKLPHAEDCGQYHECTFGRSQLRTCPEGFLFDRTVGACNNDFMVTTCPGMEFPDIGPEPPLEPGLPADPDDPSFPGGPLPSCETGQVHFAQLNDCTKYFLCVRGNLWEHTCPSALHWNERAMACDMPEHAGCMSAGYDPEGPAVPGVPPGDPPTFPEWGMSGKPGKPGKPGRPAVTGQRPGAERGTEPIRRLIRVANSDHVD